MFADPKPYITFRNLTVAVVVLWLLTLVISVWIVLNSGLPALTVENYRKICPLVRSPLAILANIAFVSLGFWIVRRYRGRYYLPCVALYAMCLANILGVFETWILCHLLFDRT
jgi:hypothetical protein